MARAMRPVVFLMLVATVLFIVDGVLDRGVAGQGAFDDHRGVGWASYLFAFANLLMAVAVARGSERTLLGRIALAMFFIVERPVTAFVLGPTPLEAIAVHLATAFVELVILVGAVRVWRLGHSVAPADVDALLALHADGPGAATAAAMDLATPIAVPAGLAGRGGSAWLLGGLTLLLAATLVADGAVAGFIPGGRDWGLSGGSSGWLAYVFAVVILAAATRAVHGGTAALRLLFALALISSIERAFGPFALQLAVPEQLGLHGLAAFAALALALATAGAIRSGGPRSASSRRASPAT